MENIWTAKVVHELINLVQENTVIYDQSDPDHSNRELVEQVWQRIALEINQTAEDCSRKWQSLRSGYRKRRYSYRSRGPGVKKVKQWAYFKALSFLESDICDRKAMKNLKNASAEVNTEEGGSYSSDEPKPKRRTYGEGDELEHVDIKHQYILKEVQGLTDEQEAPAEISRCNSTTRVKKGSNESHHGVDEDFSNYLKSITEKNNNTTRDSRSSMELFLLSLAEDASSLTRPAQREFKIKTLELLDQLRAPELC